MSNRISSTYNQSSGDSGYSLLLDGHKLPKNHASCRLYSQIEWLNYSISKLLVSYDIRYDDLSNIFNWIKNNSFSLSSFCFLKGDTDRHTLPIDFSDNLERLVKELKLDRVIGESSDFTIHNNKKYINLDGIRIVIRDTEITFTDWRRDEIVNEFIVNTVRNEPDKAQKIVINIDSYASYLNRLSTFIWLATRKEAQLCGDFDTQTIWKGGITNV